MLKSIGGYKGTAKLVYEIQDLKAINAELLAALKEAFKGLEYTLPNVPKKQHVWTTYKYAKLAMKNAEAAIAKAEKGGDKSETAGD